MFSIPAAPLTRAAFAPFGDVVEGADDAPSVLINSGQTRKFPSQAKIEIIGEGGRPVIGLYRSLRASPLPVTISSLERHPLGSQAFIPLSSKPFLIVVAPSDAQPSDETVKAFVTNGRQGVNLARGVWHHHLLTFGAGEEFVVVDRAGEGNFELIELEAGIRVNSATPPGGGSADTPV